MTQYGFKVVGYTTLGAGLLYGLLHGWMTNNAAKIVTRGVPCCGILFIALLTGFRIQEPAGTSPVLLGSAAATALAALAVSARVRRYLVRVRTRVQHLGQRIDDATEGPTEVLVFDSTYVRAGEVQQGMVVWLGREGGGWAEVSHVNAAAPGNAWTCLGLSQHLDGSGSPQSAERYIRRKSQTLMRVQR